MKKFTLLFGMFMGLGMAQVEFHGTQGSIIVDAASYTAQQPNLPGMGLVEQYLGVSIQSSSSALLPGANVSRIPGQGFFTLTVELQLADGSVYHAPVKTVKRIVGGPTTLSIPIGIIAPVKIILLSVAQADSIGTETLVSVK
jgi:hypothetical protein